MSRRRHIVSESHKRSILKAVSYRLVGSTVTCSVAWFMTGSVWTSLSIGLADSLIKVVSFYFHERAWHRVKWGLVEQSVADGRGGGI
jgi:uncharacterized membrane protein